MGTGGTARNLQKVPKIGDLNRDGKSVIDVIATVSRAVHIQLSVIASAGCRCYENFLSFGLIFLHRRSTHVLDSLLSTDTMRMGFVPMCLIARSYLRTSRMIFMPFIILLTAGAFAQ